MATHRRHDMLDAESQRLVEDDRREKNWKRWGPYLSERQWATVREDYSDSGDTWGYFPHDHARSRAYRWGEDGLFGWTDRQCRLCFSVALWNGRDPILKERMYGLTGPEGNHGEDPKELWFYLDSTPTYSHTRALYKYPQRAFPYDELLEENQKRTRLEREFEILDTDAFDDGRYFDVFMETAKENDDDMLFMLTVMNRGPEASPIHLLPTLWFRNTWAWGRTGEGYWPKPTLGRGAALADAPAVVWSEHSSLGRYELACSAGPSGEAPSLYFTENETNKARLWQATNDSRYVKDAFHARVVQGNALATNPDEMGTKAAAHYAMLVEPGASATVKLRLRAGSALEAPTRAFDKSFDSTFAVRLRFDSGETLKLPEDGAGAALLDFAKRDGAHPLLGRGWVSFDMRDPAKLVARRPDPATERQVADPGDAPATTTTDIAATQGQEG